MDFTERGRAWLAGIKKASELKLFSPFRRPAIMGPAFRLKHLLLLLTFFAPALGQAPENVRSQASITTPEHLRREKWWPTKQVAEQSGFAGAQACAGCHRGIARTQKTTQMAETMMAAADSPILAAHTGRVFALGPYSYAVERAGASFRLKVTDGRQVHTNELQWAFGSGALAQGYAWWENGQLYESRFNYFPTVGGFDRTPGRLRGAPITLDMAAGRKVAGFEGRRCMACHSTALTATKPLSAAQFQPGIRCEGCHGPGRDHIAAIKAATSTETQIVNPAQMPPVQALDFCGACHGTPRDVELMGMSGTITVRFPAYRLEKSRYWSVNGDARLTCFACHDPHRPLQRDAAVYDAACLRCHANGPKISGRAGMKPACPVAKSRCTSCHMPKYDVPEMHNEFTDHDIRVVKANAPFPD